MPLQRRSFIKHTAAGLAAGALFPSDFAGNRFNNTQIREIIAKPILQKDPKESIKFSVIGINHGHIYSIVNALKEGGGQLISVYAKEPDLVKTFTKTFPDVKVASSEDEILNDRSIQLIASAGIPVERAPLGIRVMKAGKDYVADKPGIVTLQQLDDVRKVQKETKRIYSIMYSERLGSPAAIHAGELVKSGAIGKVVQTIGLGPHRMSRASRPEWFFDPEKAGGILCDIGSHQADQFLYYTNSKTAKVSYSQTRNFNLPEYPSFQDFGDMLVRSDQATGYIRVDWFTPDGLPTWGDGRTFILGTDGYIEMRKYVDIAGRQGENHLFLVNNKETLYVDCSKVHLPYGEQLVRDVVNRTETSMSQMHCFLATELALIAQKNAK
ncbi:MAG TPA: Gfo/Idh/MocA family oxidoreductase [Bacteroidales bacterium]|nr:Gfo/Idh/MocA family oxidoreductase [Bacteroidales bacterium]